MLLLSPYENSNAAVTLKSRSFSIAHAQSTYVKPACCLAALRRAEYDYKRAAALTHNSLGCVAFSTDKNGSPITDRISNVIHPLHCEERTFRSGSQR